MIGALECSWNRKGKIYHELDLVYQIEIDNLDLEQPPIPVDHKFHMFVWKSLDQLDDMTILPEKLKSIIKGSIRSENKPVFLSQMIEKNLII